MDTSILFVPNQTPLTGIDFYYRLPFGDAEKSRKAIRDYLTIRNVNLKLKNQMDDLLPLAQAPTKVHLADILDLRKFLPLSETRNLSTSFFFFFFSFCRKY